MKKHLTNKALHATILCALLLQALAPRTFVHGAVFTLNTVQGPIAITEIVPNALNENSGELFEIVNISQDAIDLSTWNFVDASGTAQGLLPFTGTIPFGRASALLEPDQVGLVLDKDYSGEYDQELLSLDTSDEIVLLTTSSGNLSLANGADTVEIHSPEDVVSDSYSWQSDPGSEVSFGRTALNGEFSEISILPNRSLGYVSESTSPQIQPDLVISELLPAPETGEEFIEIFNRGSLSADLSLVSLRDASGKQKTLEGIINPSSYSVAKKSESGISLNNDGDQITLLWNDNGVELELDTTTYSKAPAGSAWALYANKFVWTTSPTPGEKNFITTNEEPEEDTEEPFDDSDEEELKENVISIDKIAELKELPEGTFVSLKATTTTEVGLFYKDTAHIEDASSAALIKFNEIEDMSAGSDIQVTGSLDTYQDLPRVTAQTVTLMKRGVENTFTDLRAADVNEKSLGRLVRVNGVVTKRSGKSFRIADSNSEEGDLLVSIRKNSGITAPAPNKDSDVVVTGIVLASNDQIVVAPRNLADLTDGIVTTEKTLPKTGSDLWTIILLTVVSVGSLLAGVFSARQVLRHVEWLDLSKSYRGHDDQ